MPFRFGIDKAGTGLSVTRYIEKPSEREAIVPDEVAVIGNDAFRGCGNIEKVTLPVTAKRIMSYAFADCFSLRDVALGGTEEIGRGAFSGCIRLRSIYLPDSVKFIDTNAFSYCPNLTIHCFENSYVHKFCLSNRIDFRLVTTAGIEDDE